MLSSILNTEYSLAFASILENELFYFIVRCDESVVNTANQLQNRECDFTSSNEQIHTRCSLFFPSISLFLYWMK